MQKRYRHLKLIPIALLALFFYGCKENPDTASAPKPEPVVFPALSEGMTQSEVKAILGEPNGTMSSGNQVSLLYKSVMLNFTDGKLIMPSGDALNRINQQIKDARQPAVTAETGTQKAAASPEKKTERAMHPVLLKAKRAMYDAERAAYERERAVIRTQYGDAQEHGDFPSFESWNAEN